MKSRSARCYVFFWITGMTLVTVVGYTFLLRHYFFEGLDLTSAYKLEIEARDFAEAYRQAPDTPLPKARFITSYIGLETLPDWILGQFPPDTHTVGKSQREFWWPEGADRSDDKQMHVLYLFPFDLHDGRRIYLFQQITPDHAAEGAEAQFDRIISTLWPLALFFIGFSVFGTIMMIRRMQKPVETLANWADSLTIDNKDGPRPHFRYQEHDQIAEKLQQAFQRVGAVVEREHQFLRHASHELRTPIAVLRSNIELLNRIEHDCEVDERALAPWQRIERAVTNMQHMTETLLWLSRDTPIDKDIKPLQLDQMLHQLIEENDYLLQNKTVELKSQLPPKQIDTAATPCRIALNNLIRNAFQYTLHGWVRVELNSSQVVIANANTETSSKKHDSADYGFGLGLRLVQKICEQMDWQFRSENIVGGRRVTLWF